MNQFQDRSFQNKNETTASAQSIGSKSIFHFQDNRPQSVAQRKQSSFLIDNRPRSIIQLKQVEALRNNNSDRLVIQKKENKTGLPDNLKSGIENLSGISMSDVKVHYHSPKPAQLNAHAYAQGSEIHVASGQEKHLPHEAWHVVQQKQGRVRPTIQLKNKVNVNDDASLEKEADVMGAKALQTQRVKKNSVETPIRSHDNPIQRAITVDVNTYTAEELYGQLLAHYGMLTAFQPELRNGILPVWNRENRGFLNLKQVYDSLIPILATYRDIFGVEHFNTFAGYIASQTLAQTAIAANAGNYRSLVTTAGFEHEFADMKDGPLAGVSHLELARSVEALPYTNIHFNVETDAMNALELVSPPFIFPTVAGAPIPNPDTVRYVNNLMKTTLYNLLTESRGTFLGVSLGRRYIRQTFNQLLAGLNGATGLTFNLLPEVVIKAEHLSHRTDLGALAAHVAPAAGDPHKMILNAGTLGNITVGDSQKNRDEVMQVGAQVNFATDMNTAQTMNQGPGLDENETRIFRIIRTALAARIPQPVGGSPGLLRFYNEMLIKLSSLFSVYSQNHVRTKQADMQGDLIAKATPHAVDRNVGRLNDGQQREFLLHATLSSFVKDVQPAWVKDHLDSIGAGLLQPDDYPILLASLNAANLAGFNIPQNISNFLTGEGHTAAAAHWSHFVRQVRMALILLRVRVARNRFGLVDTTPRAGLYEHTPLYTGARQDTYLDPRRVQQPGIWNRRLHVAEIRRGDPAAKLEQLRDAVG